MTTPQHRASLLRDQVMKTWAPPKRAGGEDAATIAQTAVMHAIAFVMGPEFMPDDMTPNQKLAIDSGMLMFNRVFPNHSEPKPTVQLKLRKLIKELRGSSRGYYVWRVQDKNDKAYCIEFKDHERWEAEAYWKEYSTKYPDYHKNNELARVHVMTYEAKLMIQAADALEALTANTETSC